jgi:hypothetical protein
MFVVMAAAAVCLAGAAFATNSLIVNAGSALNNTGFGLQVTVDGSTNNVYVQSDHPNAETHYLARFFICPSSLALNPNTSVRVMAVGDATLGQHIMGFMRRDMPGGGLDQWLFNTWVSLSDSAPTTYVFGTSTFVSMNAAGTESCATTSASHRWFEIEYTAGTGADGSLYVRRLVYNGSTFVEKSVLSRNTDGLKVDNIRIGALAGSGANASAAGDYKFDEFESYR